MGQRSEEDSGKCFQLCTVTGCGLEKDHVHADVQVGLHGHDNGDAVHERDGVEANFGRVGGAACDEFAQEGEGDSQSEDVGASSMGTSRAAVVGSGGVVVHASRARRPPRVLSKFRIRIMCIES